jgi:hypothetical protein
MPAKEYATTRSDGHHIGKAIREVVRLMVQEGETWQRAADSVGLNRQSAYRALHKRHVISYRREQRKQFIEMLSTRVPQKLSSLMDSDNAAAAVRAALALEQLNIDSRSEPTRRIQTGGIIIMLGPNAPRSLPTGEPTIALEAVKDATEPDES